jgi:hypothetical protein
MPTLEIPSQEHAQTKVVTLKCSTGKGDAKKEHDFQAKMPASLADAIALEGEKATFKRYLNSLAIELQGTERAKLAPEEKNGPGRKRASYLEELGV